MRIDGTQIITDSGYEVSKPAIMFDKTGVFHKFGNFDDLLPVFNTWKEKDITGEISKDLVLMVFDRDKLTLEEVVEIVQKMMDISGHCKVFYEELIKNTMKENESK